MALRSLTPAVRAFLESMRIPCVISTLRADGSPITSATLFALAGDDIVVSTPRAHTKARNVSRDPRVSFIVDAKERPYRGVAIEGAALLEDDEDGALLQLIVERYALPQDGAAMRARLRARGERVILRIVPERIRPWGL
ncbi:MAG: TIGR03618 family F420-dependent PPOX class oxidoreductase [Dehalococcoidia bacterium]